MAGIAQGSLNLPDNIAEIGHGIIRNSWPCACGFCFKKNETPVLA
jgi:hypothetical protein